MFLTRHIGSILRGNSTPFQILAACILASMLAFVPGFKQAPGLLVTLIVLIIVVNGNLTLSVQIGILAKLVSIPLVQFFMITLRLRLFRLRIYTILKALEKTMLLKHWILISSMT